MNKIQALIHDNAFLTTLLEAIPCSVLIVDKNYIIQTVNNFLEKKFEIEANSLLKKASDISDVLQCSNTPGERKICGSKGACSNCQIFGLMHEALQGDKSIVEK